MKTTFYKRATLAVACLLVCGFAAMAQSKIENLITQYEKDSKVNVVYTEERNPGSKRIVRKTINLKGDNKKQFEALWKAFEDERNNSVSIVKNNNKNFIIKFLDSSTFSTYILTNRGGGSWMLVVSVVPANEYAASTTIIPEFDSMLAEFADLQGLKQTINSSIESSLPDIQEITSISISRR